MTYKIVLSVLLLIIINTIQGQSLIYSYDFEMNSQQWNSDSISNSGYWEWKQNGSADKGVYWNNRPPIDNSYNGALVYDGDHIIDSNQGDTTMSYITAIESPRLDFSTNDEVFIKFNQYFRNYDSETKLEISSDLGITWNAIPLNTGVNRNVETNAGDFQIVDISDYAANRPIVSVRFLIEGRYYFWILDNIEFYDGYPVIPTEPSYIGEYLTEHGYRYEVDDYGWPFIPEQAVVKFSAGTSEAEKELVRNEVGAIVENSCVCNSLENWLFIDSLLIGDIGLSSTGPTTGADEQVMTSNSSTEVDDVDFNYYVQSELQEGAYSIPEIEVIIDSHSRARNANAIKIGVIDTGIDLLHSGLKKYLFLSEDKPFNEIDDDENCYVDDVIGWNFVDDNNNASDDQGHGSHVAGIITNHISSKKETKLIPYKTHDYRGIANLYTVTCGVYLAIRDEVSVINCSWGFYGNESEVLKEAIVDAWKKDIIVVAASGNDSLYLNELKQYPACYKLDNLISVGSYSQKGNGNDVINSPFSNYGSKYVDVLAPGVKVWSTVPNNDYQYKTGTSMAAPFVSGMSARLYEVGYNFPDEIKESILFEAIDFEHLEFEVLDGNVLLESMSEEGIGGDFDSILDSGNSTKKSVQLKTEKYESLVIGNELRISKRPSNTEVSIDIFNVQGQIVTSFPSRWHDSMSTIIIDLQMLSPGIYFVRINDEIKKLVYRN